MGKKDETGDMSMKSIADRFLKRPDNQKRIVQQHHLTERQHEKTTKEVEMEYKRTLKGLSLEEKNMRKHLAMLNSKTPMTPPGGRGRGRRHSIAVSHLDDNTSFFPGKPPMVPVSPRLGTPIDITRTVKNKQQIEEKPDETFITKQLPRKNQIASVTEDSQENYDADIETSSPVPTRRNRRQKSAAAAADKQKINSNSNDTPMSEQLVNTSPSNRHLQDSDTTTVKIAPEIEEDSDSRKCDQNTLDDNSVTDDGQAGHFTPTVRRKVRRRALACEKASVSPQRKNSLDTKPKVRTSSGKDVPEIKASDNDDAASDKEMEEFKEKVKRSSELSDSDADPMPSPNIRRGRSNSVDLSALSSYTGGKLLDKRNILPPLTMFRRRSSSEKSLVDIDITIPEEEELPSQIITETSSDNEILSANQTKNPILQRKRSNSIADPFMTMAFVASLKRQVNRKKAGAQTDDVFTVKSDFEQKKDHRTYLLSTGTGPLRVGLPKNMRQSIELNTGSGAPDVKIQDTLPAINTSPRPPSSPVTPRSLTRLQELHTSTPEVPLSPHTQGTESGNATLNKIERRVQEEKQKQKELEDRIKQFLNPTSASNKT